jgi:DNA repair protein RadA/Sms
MASPDARRTSYACDGCGYRAPKWLGRCPECGAWGGLVERAERAQTPSAPVVVRGLSEIGTREATRMPSGLGELDRVLGGGLAPGAVILIGGEPGVGKSTLLLQAAAAVAARGLRVLYVTGEESAAQLRVRGDRLGVQPPELLVAADTRVEPLLDAAERVEPALLVIDSIQAVACVGGGSVAGSVSQVRESAARIVAWAKSRAVPVLLVGHVTKDGTLAGPRVLEHAVDVVVQFEGDRHHDQRILRAAKNRFGPVDEIGVFRMTGSGLVEVPDPSGLLLAGRRADAPGSAVLAAVQGSRPLLVEVQALVGEPVQGSARRASLGFDSSRVALILAVLERHAGLVLAQRDVFVNVTGGITLEEPAADLAVAIALVSSARGESVPGGIVVAGELGLTGEVRSVGRLEARLREAARLGFARAVVPAGSPAGAVAGLEPLPVRDLAAACRRIFAQIG